MKSQDPILARWAETLVRKATGPALIDVSGHCLRTFQEVEDQAVRLTDELAGLPAGAVLAVQIGNHPAWLAVVLAGLRRAVVVLPIETTVTDDERAAVLQVCGAAALLSAKSADAIELRSLTSHKPAPEPFASGP